MSMTKKRSLILASSSVIALGLTVGILTVNRTVITGADACDHDGYHHAAVEPGCSAGNAEYWACCKCHSKFLTNPGGTFADWEGAEPALEEEHIAYRAPVHHFLEDGSCSNCAATVKSTLGLNDGTVYDALPTNTLSSVRVAEGALTAGTNVWGSYDYPAYGGFDFHFTYNYQVNMSGAGGSLVDSYTVIYLFNQVDESGIKIRFNNNENDGHARGYIYGVAGGNVDQNAGLDNLFVAYSCGYLAGQDVDIHISCLITDPSDNTIKFRVAVGGKYVSYVKNTHGENVSEFTTTLGATYFDNNAHKVLRIYPASTYNTSITDSAGAAEVAYVNEAGTVLGKKTVTSGSTVALPTIHKTGYTFVGWYDDYGNKFLADTTVVGDTRLVARFVETQSKMLSPSDFGFDTAGGHVFTKTTTSSIEAFKTIDDSKLSGSVRNDTYFNYKPTLAATSDCQHWFGFPYDCIDGNTRIFLRIDLTRNADSRYLSTWRSYRWGMGIAAGAAETNKYVDSSFVWNYSASYRIHFFIEETGANAYNVGIDITNLSNGQVCTIPTVAITGDSNYSITKGNRNGLCLRQASAGGGQSTTYEVRDAL